MQKLTQPFKLVEESINIFKKKENFLSLVKIYLPLAFFPITSIIFAYIPFFKQNTESAWFIALLSVVRVLYLFVSVFVTASVIIAIPEILNGKSILTKDIYKRTKKVFWMFLLLNIVLTILYVLGFALLVIPGILLIVWLAFVRFIAIEEGLGIKKSILKSKMLTKGIYWKILWRLIIFGVFGILVETILGAIPFGIGSIIWALIGGLFIIPPYLLYKEISA